MNDNQKSLLASLIIIVIIFFVELFGGLVSNSLALLSDAGHMLTDVMALALAFTATIFAARAATAKNTYGFYRLEILSALFNGSILTVVALFIFYEAYQRIIHPSHVEIGWMLMVATIGFLANVGAAVILAGKSKENLNVRGAFLHVLSDMASSVGVIIGGIVLHYTGWTFVDPVIGILIGVLILRGAVLLVFESAQILLEAAPRGVDVEEVTKTICDMDGVEDIHDLHVWTITSGLNAVSAHLVIEADKIAQTAKIIENIKKVLKEKYSITHATFQTECESCEEEVICCLQPVDREIHKHEH